MRLISFILGIVMIFCFFLNWNSARVVRGNGKYIAIILMPTCIIFAILDFMAAFELF